MIRRIALFKVKAGTPEPQVKALEELIRTIPKNIPNVTKTSVGAASAANGSWTHFWDLEVDGPNAVQAYLNHPYHLTALKGKFNRAAPGSIVEDLTMVYFTPALEGSRNADLKRPIRRTMLIQVAPQASFGQVREMEDRMLEMPAMIPQIQRWGWGRPTGDNTRYPYTFVREHEFADEEAVQAYAVDKFHQETVRPKFTALMQAGLIANWTIAWYRAPESYIRAK